MHFLAPLHSAIDKPHRPIVDRNRLHRLFRQPLLAMRSTPRSLVMGVVSLMLCSLSDGATLTGRVRDTHSKANLLGATVVIRELNREIATDADGEFTISDVPPGRYLVVASFLGYQDVTQTVTVPAEGVARADFQVGSEVVALGAFVVEGEREGQARALQQKRTADNILDIVASDNMGKLPDGNAAEAVRRLPGVFAEIDQNEGRYIVVRGIDANLNNITINGVSVGSTESGGRGAGMDSVPADLISRIEVIKAVTPDMDHQAIGASVNIVTPSAFDREGSFAHGTLAGGYFSGPSDDLPYSGSATYGTKFGDGKWGIVVGGSYSYRHYISNRRSGGNPWYPAAAGSDIYFPGTEALFHYDVQRWRQGANAALEFRPNERHQFALRISDNRFKDEEGREQNNFEFFRTTFPASFTPTTATFTGGRATVEYRYYKQKHNITSYAFEGKHALGTGRLELNYTLALGQANKETPDRQDWEFRSGANISSTVDISSEYWTVTPSDNFYNAASYPFRRVRFRRDSEEEDNYSAKIDLKESRQFAGYDGFWQIGGKYYSRDKGWDRNNVNYLAATGVNTFNLGQFDIWSPAHEMFDGRYKMSPQINLKSVQAFFRENPRFFVSNTDAEVQDSAATDFQMDEEILAGYGMGRVNFGRWSVLAGVRVEHSRDEFSVVDLPFQNGAFLGVRRFTTSASETNVLPGIHVRFTPQKNWVFRASWTNTLGRPNYPDLAAARSFSFVADTAGGNIYTGSVSQGNPDLKPYESMNFDVASEYYFKNSGIASVGLFHKRIDNPVFTNAYALRNTTYEGLNFSTLSFSRPENAESGEVTGVELNYQQQLTILPAPFDGFGFSANATFVDSEERLFSRPTETLRFAKQADTIYNAALFYEKFRFKARLAYTFTGDFIKAFGSDVHSDQYQSERKIIDAKVSYRLNKNLSLFADVINLGEEPLDEYAGFPNRNQATERYWWTANFGVNWRL